MDERHTRRSLALAMSASTVIVFAFLWALNLNQPPALKQTLNLYLLALGAFAVALQSVFLLKGDIFDGAGRVEKGRVLAMAVVVLVVAQLATSFASYAYRQLDFLYGAQAAARTLYARLDDEADSRSDEDARAFLQKPDVQAQIAESGAFARVSVLSAADAARLSADTVYRFPLAQGVLVFHLSDEHARKVMRDTLSELLSVFAATVFLTIELMLFALKRTELADRRRAEPASEPPVRALAYVRQIAFVFYFSSRMAQSFIPVLARSLGGSFFGMTGSMRAGLPQSAETLFTCAAIFLTARLVTKRGWKLPFLAGLGLVAVGTLASALVADITAFVVARAVVGLGYGFCWMTLRNFALFGRNAREKAEGFTDLNAGLYAGINCGAVLGSVLAEKMGYAPVLLLTSAFTLLCVLLVFRMENCVYRAPRPVDPQTNSRPGLWDAKGWSLLALFVLLMIAPSCLVAGFKSTMLPIYFVDIGHGVADVGRAQLLYGLVIIYLGPFLGHVLVRYPNLLRWNYAYNALLAAGLILFGLFGGLVPAFVGVGLIALADSFGFVAQNNYFLSMDGVRRLGESRSLSYLSFLKKMAEMLGPILFALTLTPRAVLLVGLGILALVAVFWLGARMLGAGGRGRASAPGNGCA